MQDSKGGDMLEISLQKVVQVIFLAREGEAGSAELHAFIDAMNDEEKPQLTAIAWIGRGAFEPEDFAEALATATAEATTPTADYLMGMPHLAENLEAGLDALGVDVAGEEEDLL
jgi:cobyrinic acid a,c-diamide synthase